MRHVPEITSIMVFGYSVPPFFFAKFETKSWKSVVRSLFGIWALAQIWTKPGPIIKFIWKAAAPCKSINFGDLRGT